MNIIVSDRCYLSWFSESDTDDLFNHLQEIEIHNNTLTIPHPYTREHAVKFIESKQDSKYDFAILNHVGMLIGCIGVRPSTQAHSAAIGYWLAKPYWRKGIMTEVVTKFTDFCFAELGFTRISATCFAHNIGSSRVLEKSGFNLEGMMTNYYKKNEKFYNAKLFAKVK